MENNKMQAQELKGIVSSFLQEHRQASLATTFNNKPRTSPVEYFVGEDMSLYIISAGGSKFDAIRENPNVCLLVNTEFINHRQIKGVQIFGNAKTSDEDSNIISEAKNYSPEPYLLDNHLLKVIKIKPEEIVYLNSIGDGNRTKQILKNDQVLVHEDLTPSIH
ncbi:pyridoxamine 5'-phosphate oxidase family protein [Sporosalibacterium faouarense]|uniref:pyridoxamine 5'-phosphate oxidase family protein n=1 Tax=Sporosalibacterium faouarense TaxID=516123 RepID=UPI00141D13E7|nr:pyridoxamine 5'-phosphate oxidase family protein [Sporosalibacterium faouarense]MTI49547.1 pyridoxamine 5'-phosphate oxidase family protein [Bacillota bacterium]